MNRSERHAELRFIFGLFAGISLLVSLYLIVHETNLSRNGIHVSARVVGAKQYAAYKGGKVFSEIFGFALLDGTRVTCEEGGTNSGGREWKIGDVATVIYSKENQNICELDDSVARWEAPIIFGTIGIVLLVIIWISGRV